MKARPLMLFIAKSAGIAKLFDDLSIVGITISVVVILPPSAATISAIMRLQAGAIRAHVA